MTTKQIMKRGQSTRFNLNDVLYHLSFFSRSSQQARALLARGLTARKLSSWGFSSENMMSRGYSIKELLKIGYKPVSFSRMVTIPHGIVFLRAGCRAPELRVAGITASGLASSGASARALKNAGFTLGELKSARFSQRVLDSVFKN